MSIWIPRIGDKSLICQKEKGNECDPYTVAITRNNVVVGLVPENICDHFWKIISLPITSIRVRVLGKRVNHGAGLCFIFFILHALFFEAMSKKQYG